MTSQPTKLTVAIHKLLNISRSKGDQKMKFRQLIIECKMTNIFLEKSYKKYGGETIHISFSKKIESEHIPGSIV